MRRKLDSFSSIRALVSFLALMGSVLLVAGSAQAMSKKNGWGCDDCGRPRVSQAIQSNLASIFDGRTSSIWAIPGRDESKATPAGWQKLSEWRANLPISIPPGLVDRLISRVQGSVESRGATPVPEPSAALVFGAGLFVAGLSVGRRRA